MHENDEQTWAYSTTGTHIMLYDTSFVDSTLSARRPAVFLHLGLLKDVLRAFGIVYVQDCLRPQILRELVSLSQRVHATSIAKINLNHISFPFCQVFGVQVRWRQSINRRRS